MKLTKTELNYIASKLQICRFTIYDYVLTERILMKLGIRNDYGVVDLDSKQPFVRVKNKKKIQRGQYFFDDKTMSYTFSEEDRDRNIVVCRQEK